MKKAIRIFTLALLLIVALSVPFSAQKTDYQIGEAEGGLLNDGKLKEAFQKAADKFEEWMYEGLPSGYVAKEDDYYLQPYADKNNQKAAIYVGSDYNSYVLRGPIYDQLESVGGLKTVGRPVSDSYEVNGVWYQNFENGYTTVPKDSGKAVFTKGSHVDKNGTVVPLTATDNGGSNTTGSVSGSENRTDTTDTDGNLMQSASQMVSDVVSDVEQAAPKWGMWVFIILLLLAIAILVIYWFLKKRR